MNSIKYFREKNNLSQTELAEKLRVRQSTISMWESGKALPRVKMLAKLSSILNVSMEELLKAG